MEGLNINAVNQIAKDTIIFRENDDANCVGIVLRGRVKIQNKGASVIAGAGSFIGVPDTFLSKYQSSYIAYDNLIVYIFEMNCEDDLFKIVGANKDYGGLLVASQSRYMKELVRIRTTLLKCANGLYDFIQKNYQKYLMEGVKSGFSVQPMDNIQSMEHPGVEEYENPELLEYYCEFNNVSLDIQKDFFSHNKISVHAAKEQSELINALIQECSETANYILNIFSCLISDEDDNLFKRIIKLMCDVKKDRASKVTLTGIVDESIEKITSVESVCKECLDIELDVDHDYLEKTYYNIMSDNLSECDADTTVIQTNDSAEEIIEEFTNSLDKLMTFAEMTDEEREEFSNLINGFIKLEDKAASDDVSRKHRKQICAIYYKMYSKIFVKAYQNNDRSQLIEMFLNYGFLDERLITEEQLLQMYHLYLESECQEPCKVYTMREWLTAIIEEEKEPSKSEFDLDYFDALREQKRVEKLSDSEVALRSKDKKRKLEYEIHNMLTYNSRVASGRITTFVPFIYKEVFYSRITSAYHSAREINASVNRILAIDYSVFHRERVYSDEENGVKKEYIMEQVFPDIILLPVCGNSGVMWQEISGRKRNTKGRFLLPIFLEEGLDSVMIQLFGRFRWELCRTIQGGAWNNIQYPSLTSEYYDYIQFYQKNRDLTPDKKEKLKNQITRGRGNTREVFLIDYIAWVTREVRGEIRLNKVARGILATYIPFPKEVRKKVAVQPIFADAMARGERERSHKIKELEARMKALEKDRVRIPDEVVETMIFYKEEEQ